MKLSKKAEWLDTNIAEIKKRSVDIDEIGAGNIMIITGENDDQIDLIKKQAIKFTVIKSEIIDFKKLKKASSLERRLNLVLNSIRDYAEYFYFESRLSDIIFYGCNNDDDDDNI